MLEIVIVIALGAIAGFAAAPMLLRKSSAEEMRLLIENGGTEELLRSAWAEDDFPEFFAGRWEAEGRDSYRRLARSLRGRKYGASRKLLVRLIRIEDERQAAKGGDRGTGADDEAYRLRMLELLDSYKGRDGFESVLAAFLAKRYKERKHGAGG